MDFLVVYSLEFKTYVVCCVRFLAESKNSLNLISLSYFFVLKIVSNMPRL